MTRSETIGELVAALAKAQAEFAHIEKDREAKVQSKTGASFTYSYADLASCVDATRPALAKNGLAVLQPIRREGPDVVVTTLLAHSSGEWIAEEMAWPATGGDSRSIGSAVTYARRYGYLAIIGAVARDEDDDAAAAPAPARPQQRQPERRPEPVIAGPANPETLARIHRRLVEVGRTWAKALNHIGVDWPQGWEPPENEDEARRMDLLTEDQARRLLKDMTPRKERTTA